METEETLDKPDPKKELIADKLMDSHAFWLKRRLWFNLLVGLCGVVPLISIFPFAMDFLLVGAAVWGLVANGLFSLGYAIESFHIMRSQGHGDLSTTRHYMFWIGTILYCIVTFMSAYSFAHWIHVVNGPA